MEFKICKLNDLSIDGGSYGIGASAVKYDKKLYTYLRITDINEDGTLNYKDMMSINSPKANQYILKKNDICFVRTGNSTGKSYFYDGSIKNLVYAGFLIKFSIDEEKVNPKYIKYYTMTSKYRNWVKGVQTGSTRGNINARMYGNLDILIPERKYQDKVVAILDKITDKIKYNTYTNDNLLKIGLELLKEDFKRETDYEVLSNAIKFVKGKKPLDITLEIKEEYKKYLTIACLNGQELNYADPTKMVLSNNDLLMVMDGASSGDVYYGGQGIVGSTLSRVDCIDDNYISEFIYFIMKYYKDLIQSKNTGSAIPHTDKVFVGTLKVPKLLIEEQKKYKTLLYKILQNINENKILEQLRDTLLPKLMNGEIDLDKIEI